MSRPINKQYKISYISNPFLKFLSIIKESTNNSSNYIWFMS